MEKKTNKLEVQNQEMLKKILFCIYVLIFLVAINLVLTLAKQDSTCSSNTDTGYDISEFKTITAATLKNELNTKEYAVLLIGKPTCAYTEKFIPILKQAQEEYDYKTLYLDLATLSEDDKKEILKYDDDTKVIEENYGSTPMVITFKDKKMVDVWIGYESFEQFSTFLEKSGFGK